MQTHTMEEIRKRNYVIPEHPDANLTPDAKSRNESALKYIEHLASLTGTDVSSWMPGSIFANEKGEFPRERNKINELFFKYRGLAETSKKDGATPASLSDREAEAICLKFDQTFAKNVNKMIAAEKEQAIMLHNEYKRYVKETEKRHLRFHEKRSLLLGLETAKKKGTGVAEALKRIISEAWWALSDTPVAGAISLITPEIRLTFVNDKAKIATAVNLGRLQLDIACPAASLTTKAVKYDNNPVADGYYHPHVTAEGNICFGDMSDAYHSAAQNFDLETICEIMRKVFTNYNDESPYVELHELESAREEDEIYHKGQSEKRKLEIRAFLEANRFTDLPVPPEAQVQQHGTASGSYEMIIPQFQTLTYTPGAADAVHYATQGQVEFTRIPTSDWLTATPVPQMANIPISDDVFQQEPEFPAEASQEGTPPSDESYF